MKKPVSLILSFFIIFNLFVPVVLGDEYIPSSSTVTGNFKTGENGSVIFDESECFTSSSNLPQTPTLAYSLNAEIDGYYYIWVYAKATLKESSGDSIWVGIDNKDYTQASLTNISAEKFQWIRVLTVYLKQGEHTLCFIPREPFLEISRISVLNSSCDLPWENSPYSTPSFNPKGQSHPRVLINKDNIDKIRANLDHGDNKMFLDMHNKALKNVVSEESYFAPGIEAFNLELNTIKSYAFEYIINNNQTYGNKAIYLIKNKLENIRFNLEKDYTQVGNLIYATAIVYDWCYPLLNNDDKEYIIETALRVQSMHSQVGWPPVKLSGFGGHGSESGVLRDLLALGIAVFDENSEIYSITAGRILDEYVAPRNLYYSSHKSLFGTSYGIYRGKHDITAMLLFKGIGKEDIFDYQISKFPYWYMYGTRGDGHYMDDGDTKTTWATTSENKGYSASYAYLALSSLYGDKTLKDAFYKEDAVLTDEYLEALIINDVDLTGESIENLNYSKFFPYPSGSYIARTGWNKDDKDNPSVVVTMKVNELNLMDHNHQDAGGFQIYYKGNLATDSGYYQTVRSGDMNNDTSGNYYQAYYKQSIAHNVMLVYDEDEPVSNFIQGSTGESYNSGGQIMPSKKGTVNYPKTAEELKNDERFNTSKVLAHEHNEMVNDPDYTYLKGDLTNAYSDKVENYERSFMFLNLKNDETPAALIVFDRVVASSLKYKKTYLLHGVNEPVIDAENKRIVLTRAEKDQFGNDYNGKLINDTLLPKSVKISKVGEEKNDYIVDTKNNVNYKTTGYVDSNGNDKGLNEGGGIRCEISPSSYRKEDRFLNVMQVSNADSKSEPLETTLIETETHTGVQIADRVVLFGNQKDRLGSDVNFSFSGEAEYKITVADLEPGKWNIFKDGVYLLSTNVTEDGGVAFFESDAGNITVTKSDGLMVNITSNIGGFATPNGTTYVLPDKSIILDITCENDYKLKSVTANGTDVTYAVKENKISVKITEPTDILIEFEEKTVAATFGLTSTFYEQLGDYNGKNAFLVFAKIEDIEEENYLVDYGMLIKEGDTEPNLDDRYTVKVSRFYDNSDFLGKGNRIFGILFYGNAIKNFKKYSVRPYAVFNLDGKKIIKYGNTTTDTVKNYYPYNDYVITKYRISK